MYERKQNTSIVFMVRPAAFGYNRETAKTNAFQNTTKVEETIQLAQQEFNNAVKQLQMAKIAVHVFQDSFNPIKPDAIFPNNWISTHPHGLAILYPMLAKNRRTERSLDILTALAGSFQLHDILDLSHFEEDGQFLEGTGSLVFDHFNQLVYAGISERTNPALIHIVCEKLNYEPVIFQAVDARQKPIYHTNVMLSIGEKFAVVCLDSIFDTDERVTVFDSLLDTKQDVIQITLKQTAQFAGNILQLDNLDGQKAIILSKTALCAFQPNQRKVLEKHGELVPLDIPTIERVGGGSARCMIAEVFLPQKL